MAASIFRVVLGSRRLCPEEQERALYEGRASTAWLADLAPLGTSWQKPFLVEAPYVIVVFALAYGLKEDGSRSKNYYVNESVGIAVGLLLAALQELGLASLTYTPSPMGFLKTILRRPANERAFMVIPVGYPASDATVPELARKDLSEILVCNVAGAEVEGEDGA